VTNCAEILAQISGPGALSGRVECSLDEVVPRGMVKWTSPEGTFATFTHFPKMKAMVSPIFSTRPQWLPRSGYTRARGPDIEQMGPEFSPQLDSSVLGILIPIRW
jgi:predicted transcriptional regulator YdeE